MKQDEKQEAMLLSPLVNGHGVLDPKYKPKCSIFVNGIRCSTKAEITAARKK